MDQRRNWGSPLSVLDAISLPPLNVAHVLSGRSVLAYRSVRWTQVVHWPAEEFIRPGDLVLTTAVAPSPEQSRKFLENVVRSDAATLIVSLPAGIDPAVVDAAAAIAQEREYTGVCPFRRPADAGARWSGGGAAINGSREGAMETTVVVAQVPVVWDIERNLVTINEVLAQAGRDEVVVLPEGALSGYGPDLSPLRTLDRRSLAYAITAVAAAARRRAVHLFCGSLLFDHGAWWNTAVYFPPAGGHRIYRKINLAVHERDHLRAGSRLPVLPVRRAAGEFTAGVQICREIRFPDQWQHLARSGAEVFVYLTNAANDSEPAGVWRSHLVSRAAENQRFVLAANAADARQHCPSTVVSPRGEVLAELPAGATDLVRLTIDLREVAGWYLAQQRRDVLDLRYRAAGSDEFQAGERGPTPGRRSEDPDPGLAAPR